jgi:hypothetical protein
MPPATEMGTLTFLFTDIEGSTRRWALDRSAMSSALADHDETIAAAEANAQAVAVASSNGVRFLESVARRDHAMVLARGSADAGTATETFRELIAPYHAAGDRQNLRMTLGYLLTLFARLDRHEAVLTVHAALSQDDLPMSFTDDERQRLTDAIDAAESGDADVAARRERGRRMGKGDVVDYVTPELVGIAAAAVR